MTNDLLDREENDSDDDGASTNEKLDIQICEPIKYDISEVDCISSCKDEDKDIDKTKFSQKEKTDMKSVRGGVSFEEFDPCDTKPPPKTYKNYEQNSSTAAKEPTVKFPTPVSFVKRESYSSKTTSKASDDLNITQPKENNVDETLSNSVVSTPAKQHVKLIRKQSKNKDDVKFSRIKLKKLQSSGSLVNIFDAINDEEKRNNKPFDPFPVGISASRVTAMKPCAQEEQRIDRFAHISSGKSFEIDSDKDSERESQRQDKSSDQYKFDNILKGTVAKMKSAFQVSNKLGGANRFGLQSQVSVDGSSLSAVPGA